MRFFFLACCCAATLACSSEPREPSQISQDAVPNSGASTPPSGLIKGTPDGDLNDWVRDIQRGIEPLPVQARTDAAAAQQKALDLYVTRQEYIEMYYGPNGRLQASAELGSAVEEAEARFHQLMQLLGTRPVDAVAVERAATALDAQQQKVAELWRAGSIRLERDSLQADPQAAVTAPAFTAARRQLPRPEEAESDEVRALLADLQSAAAAYRSGDAARTRQLVDNAYLERFEPLEARLPAQRAAAVESLIHLELRPAINARADQQVVSGLLAAVGSELLAADDFLTGGSSHWFVAFNSFVIIVREGLEAVLLIAALLAYLSALGAAARHRRQIYAGVGAGVVATIITWLLARTLIPINGASRELLEGVTALIAVLVLLYVAHWLFQKTYIHDWKNYLREHAAKAAFRGSTLAMALLAFAAVYREGFETVLFYQALLFDAGPGAILTGFVPGVVLIALLGFAIIRAGVRLPLKRLFTATNVVLLYLAFVFLGKGLYNLQEAGLFTVHRLPLPDHTLLRQFFGVYPLVETWTAQLLLVGLLAATFVYSRRRSSVVALRAASVSEGQRNVA